MYMCMYIYIRFCKYTYTYIYRYEYRCMHLCCSMQYIHTIAFAYLMARKSSIRLFIHLCMSFIHVSLHVHKNACTLCVCVHVCKCLPQYIIHAVHTYISICIWTYIQAYRHSRIVPKGIGCSWPLHRYFTTHVVLAILCNLSHRWKLYFTMNMGLHLWCLP